MDTTVALICVGVLAAVAVRLIERSHARFNSRLEEIRRQGANYPDDHTENGED